MEKQINIRELRERYYKGIHPCMIKFLIEFYYDSKTKAFYDGNHIVTDNEVFDKSKFIALNNYGYMYFKNAFQSLTKEELKLLQKYFK